MADFLYIHTIPWVKTFIKTSIAFSKHFKDKRQRKNFIEFLTSLSLTGSSLLTDVAQISRRPKYYSRSLSHFFNHSQWDPEYFEKKRKQMVLKYLLKDCSVIGLDSTALVKTGKHFENEGAVYDSRSETITDGFPMLLATGITNQGYYSPITYLRYSWRDLEKFSENQIKQRFIQEIIDLFKNEAKIPIFVADSGFLRRNIITLLLESNVPFVLKTSKRKAILKSGQKVLTDQLPSGIYPNIKIATWGWKNVHCNLVVGPLDKEEGSRRAFLTNLPLEDYSRNKILNLYQQRWFVEESIKELKQHFGLENFRVRSWQGSERLLSLLFFAVTLTHLSLFKHNNWIQHLLPNLIGYPTTEMVCFSVYYCRKMLLKILFCGPITLNSGLFPLKQARSP